MRQLWAYCLENLKMSFGAWGVSQRASTLVGALLALALAFAGMKLEWHPDSPTYWAQAIGLWFGILVILITPIRMWIDERKKVEELTEIPERISYVEVAQRAKKDLGWTFEDGLQTEDFHKAIRQAAHDGVVVLHGRFDVENVRERDKAHYLLRAIPGSFWSDRYIDVPPDGFPAVKNYDIKTRTADFSFRSGYRDLHVLEGAKVLDWLRREGIKYRGVTQQAELESQLEHRQTMGPVQAAADYMSRTAKK